MPSCLGLPEGSHRWLSATVALTFHVPQGLCISKKNIWLCKDPARKLTMT